jgi:ribosomal protein L37E
VSIALSPEVQAELAEFGLAAPARGCAIFEVDEAHVSWPALKEWITKRRAGDAAFTRFTSSEVARARWLELEPTWHHGYPQPDPDNFGFRHATYDLSQHCAVCGVGKRQCAPFQMKREPKWGRKEILQLNWVFDEYFVTPNLWREVFAPSGIASRAVCNTKGEELEGVVQLVIGGEVEIVEKGLASEVCSRCGRQKFLPVTAGPFPALRNEPNVPLAKTAEFFGSGGSAHRGVVISQELWRKFVAYKGKGASVRPVKAEPGLGSCAP